MKTNEVKFESKVEFLPAGEAGIPTAKLVGISGLFPGTYPRNILQELASGINTIFIFTFVKKGYAKIPPPYPAYLSIDNP